MGFIIFVEFTNKNSKNLILRTFAYVVPQKLWIPQIFIPISIYIIHILRVPIGRNSIGGALTMKQCITIIIYQLGTVSTLTIHAQM